MIPKLRTSFIGSSAAFSAALLACSTPVLSQEASSVYYDDSLQFNDPLLTETTDAENDSMSQVTNVNQLQDVSPADWAYEALRSLVDRYGCIAGFPNQTYRGNQPLSRYQFAAGLNSCLNQIERLIASSEAVVREDIDTINRLTQEFEAELATIGGRVDSLESRTAFLEDNQFSTTTKLVGEVAFTLANAFGEEEATDLFDDGIDEDSPDLSSQVVFNNRIRLQLVSSFTGEDKLFTRLTAGNIANSFQDETGTREGRFAHDGPSDNNVVIDRLHYTFGVLDGNLQVTAMAVLAAHHFYAEVFNDGLNTGGGATGALTRFGERNPIYRQGIARSSAGLGLSYSIGEKFEITAGYIAPGASDPDEGAGLFNGTYSALGQLTFKPFDRLKLGVTYVRGYSNQGASILWGGTGTNQANDNDLIGNNTTNSYGAQFQWDVVDFVSLRGWFTYTDIDILDGGDAEVLTYAGALVFPDLGKEGNLGALVVGAEPYLTDIDLDSGNPDFADDIPLHVEAFYKYQLNDNISITPGVVWLASPNQNGDNDDIFIGAIRTTFTF